MTKFPMKKLSELCSEILDCVNKTAPESADVTPFKMLRTSNIRNGIIDYENVKYVSEETYMKWTRRGKLKEGDIVFTREAPLGEVGMLHEADGYFLGQRLVLFRADETCCYNRFLLYALQFHDVKESITSSGVGATVVHMRVPECANISVPCPCLSLQKKIGDTLYHYDSLIENNRRQIKLLEEAAQRLYKEWFVDLRFPGHEHTPIVNGIPQGWKMACFGDEIDYVRGRSYSSKELSDKGECLLINLKNIRSHGGYLPGGEKGYIGEYKTEQCAHLGDLIMSVTDMTHERRLVGHVALVPQLKSTAIISMDLIKLIPRAFPVSYIYSVFNYGKLDEQAAQYANGTNVLHLKPSCLADLEFVSPPNAILEKYDDFFCALMGMMNALYAENASLTEARDRLLPKLMSGEVEV